MGVALKSKLLLPGFALVIAVALGLAGKAHALPQLKAAAPAAWIRQGLDVPAAEGGSPAQGTRILLYDRQVLLGAREVQSYTRWVQAVADESGLNALSQLTIEFEGDETLVLHHVRVQRAGVTLDRLNMSEVRVAQREDRLAEQIYDGKQTAILFVADLRVGDVLDYAYTLLPRRATAGDKFSGHFVLGLPQPVEHLHLRLIAPSARPLHDVWHGPPAHMAPDPQQTVHGKQTEYTWDLRSTPAYEIEPSTPTWYNPVPWLQVSEYKSWEEVARWGRRVANVPVEPEPEIRRFLAELPAGSEAERMLRVIRFVQDEVRYVGIETGLSRTQSALPATVLTRRYGDCKDKSGLLIALLRGLGMRAYPMLVNTRVRSRLYEWGPSPSAFDHVIVMIEAEAGPYWVDSTNAMQGGGLERLRYSEFGRGLVLRDETTQLTEAGVRPGANPPRCDVSDHFTLPEPATAGDTTLERERACVHEEAERMRTLLRSLGPEPLSKLLLEELRQDYPQARETAPATWRDDRDQNYVHVKLHYAIPKMWSDCEHGDMCAARIVARPIASSLEPVPEGERKAPLAVLSPLELHYRSEIDLTFEIEDQLPASYVRGPAFEFRAASKIDKKKLTVGYGMRTLGDTVSVAKLAEHRKAMEDSETWLARSIEQRRPVADGIHWPMICLIVLIAALSALVAVRYLRRLRATLSDEPVRSEALHIGGWLAVLALGMFARPISSAVAAVPAARLIFSRTHWDELMHPLHPESHAALITLAAVILLTLSAVCWTVLIPPFFGRRREFRKAFVWVSGLGIAISMLSLAVVAGLSSTQVPLDAPWQSTLGTCALQAGWATYVWFSKRSLETFVR